jgi:hypothetical protein
MPYSRRTGERYAAGSTTTFAGWEPRVCCLCGGRINKARDGAHRFYMDDLSGAVFSFHAGCGSLADALRSKQEVKA